MRKHLPLIIGMLALVLLLAFSFGLSKAQEASQGDERALPETVDSDVGSYFPIQGRLSDAGGNPLDGDYSITFRLYDVIEGGVALCSDTNTVHVDKGLFNTKIWGSCWDDITGQQLYLGIQVGSDSEMTPRQPIYATPYAWSLRPGAIISGTKDSDAILHIENWGSDGRGLRAYAMATTGETYGVVGASRSPQGFGGYFYNNGGGTGLVGKSYFASSPGISAQGVDYGADLVLAGNANTDAGDDGRITSDPAYASSDLVLVSNDAVRIDLDNNGDGEDADFEIYNKDNNLIFNVDSSGAVTSGGEGIAAFPRPAYDSGWIPIAHNASIDLYHNLGGNIENYVVDMTCQSVDMGINNFGSGGDYNNTEFYGAYWKSLTTTHVTITRLLNDLDCGHVRVRIWMYP